MPWVITMAVVGTEISTSQHCLFLSYRLSDRRNSGGEADHLVTCSGFYADAVATEQHHVLDIRA